MLAFLGWLALAAAAPAEHLGVFQLGVVGADPALQQTAIDAMATALTDAGFAVVSRSDLDAMLGAEKLRDAVGCDQVACMAEIGAAAGVDRIVAGSLSKIDSGWVVSLQLVNTRFATVENRVTVEWPSPSLDVINVLGAAAELVAVPVQQRGPGSLRVSGIPSDAAILVDSAPASLEVGEIKNLAVGVHALRIEASGHESFSAPFVVRRGRPTRLDVTLVAAPAFYTRWWFWTAAAVVVAGGTTAAILATQDDPNNVSDSATASGHFEIPAVQSLRVGGF